jgi:DNA-binding GntR family transcriptional regulator
MTADGMTPAPIFRLVEQLEADIIFGRLRPHQELLEDALMQRFGAKRHVVRAAIQELVARRIVVKPRSKSARVKDFSAREVHEIYHMRALLQREAAMIMPLPVDPALLAPLKETHVKYVAAASVGADPLLIHQLNDQFHSQLFALCGNTTLCAAITFYTEASNPIRSYGITDKVWLNRAIAEHAAMINAIEQCDRTTLARLVVDHMHPTRLRWESMRGTALAGVAGMSNESAHLV